MWHAARRQERAIKGMMVDYQKRAGRRKEYYDQIKQDPNQFLRVNGHSMKIHIDPSLVIAAEAPQIMQKWQGDNETLIDRYDVRSHIDYLPTVQPQKENLDIEESRCNYERYRILVQNDCVGVTEQQCLSQIEQDERFGCISTKEDDKKKKSAEKKVAIGYSYDAQNGSSSNNNNKFVKPTEDEEEEEDDDELDEVDLDNILDIELLTEDQEKVLNKLSHSYQMLHDDYSQFLQIDRDEMEALRKVREIEEEKAAYSGRKSRRERKAFKDQRMKNRRIASPSYLNKGSPKKDKRARSSSSRSKSPDDVGKVEFITSFGGGDDVVVVGDEVSTHENQYQGSSEVIGPQLPSRMERKSPSKRSNRGRRSRSRSRERRFRIRSRGRRSKSRSRGRRRSKSRDKRSRSRDKRYRSRRKSRSRRSRSSSSSSSPSYRRSSDVHRNRSVRSSKRSSSSSSNNRKHKDTSCELPPNRPPIKKYRRDSLSSSDGEFDEDDDDDDDDEDDVTSTSLPISRPEQWRYTKNIEGSRSSKDSSKASLLTPQERLKRKMQMTLKKQYKADKKARLEKENKEELLKQEREDELRVLSLQLRQRERERRHKQREEFDRLESKFKRSRSRSKRRRSSSRRSPSGSKRRRSRSRQKPKLVAY